MGVCVSKRSSGKVCGDAQDVQYLRMLLTGAEDGAARTSTVRLKYFCFCAPLLSGSLLDMNDQKGKLAWEDEEEKLLELRNKLKVVIPTMSEVNDDDGLPGPRNSPVYSRSLKGDAGVAVIDVKEVLEGEEDEASLLPAENSTTVGFPDRCSMGSFSFHPGPGMSSSNSVFFTGGGCSVSSKSFTEYVLDGTSSFTRCFGDFMSSRGSSCNSLRLTHSGAFGSPLSTGSSSFQLRKAELVTDVNDPRKNKTSTGSADEEDGDIYGDEDDYDSASTSSSDLFELDSLTSGTNLSSSSARSSLDPEINQVGESFSFPRDRDDTQLSCTTITTTTNNKPRMDGPRTYLIVYSSLGKRAKLTSLSSASSWKIIGW